MTQTEQWKRLHQLEAAMDNASSEGNRKQFEALHEEWLQLYQELGGVTVDDNGFARPMAIEDPDIEPEPGPASTIFSYGQRMW